MLNKNHGRNLAIVCALLANTSAYADAPVDQLPQNFKFSGDIRLYSFSRNYENSNLTDLHSTSLGGKLKV